MKVLKKLFFALLIIIALVAIVGLVFMPGNVETSQQVTIKAKPEVVFAHVNNLKNWDFWATWNQLDPNWNLTYGESSRGNNASYTWESEDPMVGAGTMTVTESIDNALIKTRLDFRDWDGADTEMTFEKDGENTLVTWSIITDQAGSNLFARYMNAFLGGMMEDDLAAGLRALKTISETQTMALEIEEMPEMTVAYVPIETTSEQITLTLASSYGAILQHLPTQGAEMTRMPMAHYADYRDEKVIMEPMIAINKTIDEGETVKVKTLPAQTMAVFYHYGNYTGLGAAHDEALAVLETLGIDAGVASLEIYETDPGLEPDSNKWLTKICFKID